MLRTLLVLILFLSLTTPALAESPPSPAVADHAISSSLAQSNRCSAQSSMRAFGLPTSTAQTCCKICHKGKACGNTCISRQDICHVGPGCACDG